MEAARERIELAVARREAAEGQPARLGLWMGGWSFLLAAACAASRVQPILLYAVFWLGMALLIAAAFLRLRNSQPTRVAVLTVRSTAAVIPPVWFCAGAACALTLLSGVTDPEYRLPAAIVTSSSLLTALIAWRLTTLPALLSGVDVAAEQIVDDRLRFLRSSVALSFSFVQTLAFASQMLHDATAWRWAAYALSMGVSVAFAVWIVRRQCTKVQLA
jgi:hypothetical protein